MMLVLVENLWKRMWMSCGKVVEKRREMVENLRKSYGFMILLRGYRRKVFLTSRY